MPRPLLQRSPPSNDESGNASDMDEDGQQGGRDDVEEGRDQEEVGEDMGLTVTQGMVQKWVESVKEVGCECDVVSQCSVSIVELWLCLVETDREVCSSQL